ncbi:MAG TPA: MFS transporter, partial [Jatrophihabitans sp.]|nr:MFS transporter [Jatrophihabitans sp.]
MPDREPGKPPHRDPIKLVWQTLSQSKVGEVSAAEPSQRTRKLRGAQIAVAAVFFAHGLLFASWAAHIPHVKARLGVNDGTLGLALLGAPVGSVTAIMLAAYLVPKIGSRRVVQIALVGYCAAGPFVGLVSSVAGLFVALFFWGGFQGTLDIAMNTQAIT